MNAKVTLTLDEAKRVAEVLAECTGANAARAFVFMEQLIIAAQQEASDDD